MCRENGGIVDDCIVYKFGSDHFRIVVNAANIAKDVAYFREHAGPLCTIEDRSDEFALIAVQGPKAVALVSNLIGAHLRDVPSFGLGGGTVLGAEITAARTGYTGEDGFELFVAANRALEVWNALAEAGATPIGLGARDTLRLEARLCLYGNDLTEQTDPYEAGLGWVVKLDKSDAFIGLEALRAIKAEGSKRKLVGFVVQSRGIVRPGAEVVDKGAVMGTVTSGGVAPTVGGSIGMAYVPSEMAAPETSIVLRQRNKVLQGRIVKGPFYRRASA
jgi:aminomethyltransferase